MKNYGFRIFAFCFGIFLLVFAIVLSIALLFPLMGIEVPMGFLQELESRLFSFYGYSTFVIPIIILFFAIVLIVPTWNTKLNFICASTPLYFFTFVFFEHLANFLTAKFNAYNLSGLFNVTCFLFALFVIALEVALAILFAEKLTVNELPIKDDDETVNIIGTSYTGAYSETQSENYSRGFFGEPSPVKFTEKENTIRNAFVNQPSAEFETQEIISSFVPEVKEVPNLYKYNSPTFESSVVDTMENEEQPFSKNSDTIQKAYIDEPSVALEAQETHPSFTSEINEVPNIYEYCPNPFEPPMVDVDTTEIEELDLYENEADFPDLSPKPLLSDEEKNEEAEVSNSTETKSETDVLPNGTDITNGNSVADFAPQSHTETNRESDTKQNEYVSNLSTENNVSSLLDSMVVFSENENDKNNYETENLHFSQNPPQTQAGVLTRLDETYEELEDASNNKTDKDAHFNTDTEKVESFAEDLKMDFAGEVEIPEFMPDETAETENIEAVELESEVHTNESKTENDEVAEIETENEIEVAESEAEVKNENTELESEEAKSEIETENESETEIEFDETSDEVPNKILVANDLTSDAEKDYENAEAHHKSQSQITKPKIAKAANAPVPGQPNALRYEYSVPSSLLTNYPDNKYWIVDDATRREARILKETLSEFKIDVAIKDIIKGPVVTMFELMPPPGIKLSKITSLQDNIALRLAAPSVRIVAPIPGKEAVGIEVPNANRAIVSMRELIEADIPQLEKMAVPVLLGKDITGRPQTMDIAQTPHLLIAGATGSGKSVCVNSIILSILYNRTPEQVRLLLVDPKIVELKLYNDIAHLLAPVITEPKKAFQALQYCLCEMERRYALLDGLSVRDIKSYNAKVKQEKLATEVLPYIVIIIDEFADLMATTGKELESTVARLCAMSRAVGIHLVLATQRPSINVITGLIKANIPTRIAFMVASNADSRIILDESGAEKLLGKGDMLYVSVTNPFPVRIQGSFASDADVERVVEHVKTLRAPEYIEDEIFINDDEQIDEIFIGDSDPLYDKALEIVLLEGKASASYLQRRLKIGYNRAARIVEEMYERGVVGPANGSKPREVIYNKA